MATGLGVSRGPRQTSFHLTFKAFWVQGPVCALCTRRVWGGLPRLACVHEEEGGVSLERTPSCPTRGSRGCSQQGLRVWVQSEYYPALDLRRRVCVCELPEWLCACVFSLGDAALTVAGGQSPRRDGRWLEASRTLTPTPHIWPGFLPPRGPSAGTGQTLVHSPRGWPGRLTRSPLLAGSPRTLWGMAGC